VDDLRGAHPLHVRWQRPACEPVMQIPSVFLLFPPLPRFQIPMTRRTLSSDLMQFPVAVPNDGMVDIIIQGRVSLCVSFRLWRAN
jgi:hypothetical protein